LETKLGRHYASFKRAFEVVRFYWSVLVQRGTIAILLASS
jgi:hypothetical protein